ncbi:MAG TPA: hypothetical protein VHV80_07580 [Steroidobacteraceae bacterium]|jgi:hypothetical protein|nr:hypothetical protein [Steroidobacteraceae bacterium]
MRFAVCAAILAIASTPVAMVAGTGNDPLRVDTSNAEAQRRCGYALTLSRAVMVRSAR